MRRFNEDREKRRGGREKRRGGEEEGQMMNGQGRFAAMLRKTHKVKGAVGGEIIGHEAEEPGLEGLVKIRPNKK